MTKSIERHAYSSYLHAVVGVHTITFTVGCQAISPEIAFFHIAIMQRQTAVTAYFSSKQFLLFAFARGTVSSSLHHINSD